MSENAQIIFVPGTLPESACYATEQERLNAFMAYSSGSLPGNFSTFNYGETTPGSDDRDKPWHRLNVDGSPSYPGMWDFFDGAWRQRHPLPPGVILMWDGAPGDIDTLDDGVAGTATIYTGPFWEIVTAMAARMPIGVGNLPSGTALAVTNTGGEENHTLVTNELPKHKHQMFVDDQGTSNSGINPTSSTYVYRERVADVNTDYRMSKVRSDDASVPSVAPTGEAGNDQGHNNLPPYYTVYFIRLTIRQYR